jgi:hypothetical protein
MEYLRSYFNKRDFKGYIPTKHSAFSFDKMQISLNCLHPQKFASDHNLKERENNQPKTRTHILIQMRVLSDMTPLLQLAP